MADALALPKGARTSEWRLEKSVKDVIAAIRSAVKIQKRRRYFTEQGFHIGMRVRYASDGKTYTIKEIAGERIKLEGRIGYFSCYNFEKA